MSFKHFVCACKTFEFHSEMVFLVRCSTTNFLTPPFSLAKGKCEIGIGLSSSQLASFICQMNYPSSWTWEPSSGVGDSPDCAFAGPCACLGIGTDAKAETDVSSVNFGYSQQVRFPRGACSSRKNDRRVLTAAWDHKVHFQTHSEAKAKWSVALNCIDSIYFLM